MVSTDVEAIVRFCDTNLDLARAQLSDEYYYQSLPLCVIDAVFSIGVRYTSTRNTVTRFCERYGLQRIRDPRDVVPPQVAQMSIHEFLQLYETHTSEQMAEQVYNNRQRTSPRGGILKAEGARMFGEVLQDFGVGHLQDVPGVIGDPRFETAIQAIPGQTSGISLRYFYMLAGSEEYIKPDRMITRFIQSVTGRTMGVEQSHDLIVRALEVLQNAYPKLTARLLDHRIWNYQRSGAAEKPPDNNSRHSK